MTRRASGSSCSRLASVVYQDAQWKTDPTGAHSLWPGFTNVPNEFIESYFPLRIERYQRPFPIQEAPDCIAEEMDYQWPIASWRMDKSVSTMSAGQPTPGVCSVEKPVDDRQNDLCEPMVAKSGSPRRLKASRSKKEMSSTLTHGVAADGDPYARSRAGEKPTWTEV